MFSNALYIKAPAALQSSLISLRALARKLLREGVRFDRILREIEESQHLSADDLAQRRQAKLGSSLTHAAVHVPFYREQGLGAVVAEAPVTEALAAFPIIDKRIVREEGVRFIAETAKRPLFKGYTSGTTGTPLTLYQDLAAINRENAFIWRQLEWAGFKRGDRRAWLRGDLVVPAAVEAPPFWRMNHAENMLMFSSYHLSDAHARVYIEALEQFDPVIVQAYPSSIAFLAKWLQASGRTYAGRSLRGIVTSSEALDSEQRAVSEARFGCRVFDWYGQTERVAAIGTCERGRQHIVADYSWVELLPTEDGRHELVGTGFNNFVMPLIRYRTGDFVAVDGSTSMCDCGRHFPGVATVWGRKDDAIKLPDGRSIGRLTRIFEDVTGILEAQIRQDRLVGIDILIVPCAGYGPSTLEKLLANARLRLGNAISIEVRTVQAIPRTRNGKLRTVICNV